MQESTSRYEPRPAHRYLAGAWAVWGDIRMALRVFRRSPLFTAAACLCLAIGMAVSSAMFTVLHEPDIDSLPSLRPRGPVAVDTSVTRGERERRNQNVQAIGRLKRGTAVGAARAELDVLSVGMIRERPGLTSTLTGLAHAKSIVFRSMYRVRRFLRVLRSPLRWPVSRTTLQRVLFPAQTSDNGQTGRLPPDGDLPGGDTTCPFQHLIQEESHVSIHQSGRPGRPLGHDVSWCGLVP